MTFHLAQLNVGIARLPMEHPDQAEFVDALDEINALAERSPGFVWRMTGEGNNAIDLRLPNIDSAQVDDILVNMSVWSDFKSLHSYVYRSAHAPFLKRREDWFIPMSGAHLVLWWVRQGHIPTLAEAANKLEALRVNGPTPAAFTFAKRFDAPV